jgi:ABC-type multidrug transport system ATPase subunit
MNAPFSSLQLDVDGAQVEYNKGEPSAVVALRPVSVTLHSGTSRIVEGPNGSGKTTLLRLLAGRLRPTTGKITVNTLSGEVARKWLIVNSWYVDQNPSDSLVPDLTLRENIVLFLPRRLANRFEPLRRSARVASAEERVTGLFPKYAAYARRRVSDISVGERQLFAVALSGLSDKRILLFDEPTAALDEANQHSVIAALRSLLGDPGRIVLIATHDETLAAETGLTRWTL